METSTSDQQRSYSKPVQESHLDLLSRGALSDVTFIVGPTKERIQCHQAFLGARSRVFEVMFSERWNQVQNKEIPIEYVDAKIFKKFLQFIYADTIKANVPETLELLQVAHTYDVTLLVSRCEELLMVNDVPLNDALDVFQAARKYEMVQLMDKAGDSMAKWLSELLSHPSFARMDKETLIYILKINWLNMKEVDLFRLALKWAKQQPDLTLEQSLEDILPLIRFPTMTLEEFTGTVVPTGLLPQSTLVEVFTYFGSDAETKKSLDSTLKFNTRKRPLLDSVRHFKLYSGDLTSKETKLLPLGKLRDSMGIFTGSTGNKAMGVHGICVYCPARLVGTDRRPASPTFKEFMLVYEYQPIRRRLGDPSSRPKENLLTMSSVKAEEGKMTEIKFDTVVPLKSYERYRITLEEIQPTSTQLEVSREDYFVAKVFSHDRNSSIILSIINESVVLRGQWKNEIRETLGDLNEYPPPLICGFSLEEL